MSDEVTWRDRRVDEELKELRRLIGDIMPRSTIEAMREADNLRFKRLEDGQDTINKNLGSLQKSVWIGVGSLGIISPIIAAVVTHFLR